MLGFSSSAVRNGLCVYAVANTPFGVLIRKVGPPFAIFSVPSVPTDETTPAPAPPINWEMKTRPAIGLLFTLLFSQYRI
jgi:hypothetical protein